MSHTRYIHSCTEIINYNYCLLEKWDEDYNSDSMVKGPT
jgi:hypothetical protein